MVKRVLGFGLFAFSVAVLGGCPIYGDSRSSRDCTTRYDSSVGAYDTTCYDCPNGYYTSQCAAWSCDTTYDCPSGTTCSSSNVCTTGGTNPPNPTSCSQPGDCPSGQNCGTDDKCHAGDCSNSGCPSGFQCKLAGGTLQCVGTGTNDGGAFTGCTSDSSCTSLGAGAKCLDGACVAPADQCSDATQCPNSEQCVQGVCTPSCTTDKPCPIGYACDTNKGVCSSNPTPCTDGGSACSSTTTCVDQHCVTPCGAGNTCSTGLICVDGGCIPDQKPQFICAADGAGSDCAPGSICLHHSCYIGCSADAGATACQNADKFNVCKAVMTSSGSYQVCGSSSNLGTECDPTQAKNCVNPLICVDGFCR